MASSSSKEKNAQQSNLDLEGVTPVDSHAPSVKEDDEVALDELENPKSWSSARKWTQILVICSASACATCFSSVAGFTEVGLEARFGVSHTVAILSISLFVAGLGIGPLLLGPLSEFFGRSIIYQVSYALFVALNFGVAFAPDIATHLVFRFISGFAGSAFLSVAGGSVADLFDDAHVALPMAVYTLSPFLGPVLGPAISGFINQNLYWRWTYYVMLMWGGVELVLLILLVPESYAPVLVKRKAVRLRKETGDDRYYAPLERSNKTLFGSIKASCIIPFQILLHERMALLLDLWSSLVLGVLYLTFQAFPIIFGQVHHFNVQMTGLSFLGIGIGMIISLLSQPYWIALHRRKVAEYNGHPPPEVRLYIGMAGAIMFPVGLFWIAFTTYKSVHWSVPMVASILFGTGTVYIFTTVFTFLVTAYRPYAASAMAGNSFLRSAFAAAFPLFAGPMYNKLGTVGATALLAGLSTVMSPLPFIFFKIGPRLRARSNFAHQD
ncbi:MFS general substrate transporter [Exidia glandulosa HHB12029]|uniref:MFS general substrate transporter n=1 Tax=Exidia glandulosa HHB12029 TaxID=1314781 RepID=A0A165F0X6_EXIGL|nr:MFS general substrate transporter [Exidia glandulosa HHB12029]